MNSRRVLNVLGLVVVVSLASSARAQTLDLTLTDANQTVAQGTTVVAFDATVFNPSSTATIYLNDASGTTASSFLSVDASPFFANAPLSLAPGQSSGPFELFAVDVATNASPGSYRGNDFEIQGGADGGTFTAFNDLVNSAFSLTVTSSTVAAPEIDPASTVSALVLLMGSLAVVCGRRDRRRTERT